MAKEKTKEISEEQASKEAKKYSDKVSNDTVVEVLDKEEGVKGFFKNVEALKKYWDVICLIFPLLKDWISGRYTKIPWSVIASLVGAILYVLSPLDLCPDFIPILGYLDDATVFGVAVSFAKDYLEEYKAWKEGQTA
ncbi:MAG: DUF1232 domain-containing protein [Kiritimatiellae bacterium]|nr:DUF1232 domain-containing protein [Kiritimatiellia bacterium]